jgi:hypothetical protein
MSKKTNTKENIILIGTLVLATQMFSLFLSASATLIVLLAGIEVDSLYVFAFLNLFFNTILFTYLINVLFNYEIISD